MVARLTSRDCLEDGSSEGGSFEDDDGWASADIREDLISGPYGVDLNLISVLIDRQADDQIDADQSMGGDSTLIWNDRRRLTMIGED